ncbi:MAG: hypothetical protein V3U67_04455 [Gemmatimonadota bacterium]
MTATSSADPGPSKSDKGHADAEVVDQIQDELPEPFHPMKPPATATGYISIPTMERVLPATRIEIPVKTSRRVIDSCAIVSSVIVPI